MDLTITLMYKTGHPGVPGLVDMSYTFLLSLIVSHYRRPTTEAEEKTSIKLMLYLFEGHNEIHLLHLHLLELLGERVHAAVVDGDWSPGLAADARLWHESWGLRVGDGGGHQLAACELVLVQHVEGREEDEGGEHATDLLQGVGDVRVGADEDRLADLAGDVPSDGEQLHPGEAREEGAGGGGNSRNFASHVYNHSMTVNNHLLGANYIPGYKARTTKRSGKPTHQAHLFVIPSVV